MAQKRIPAAVRKYARLVRSRLPVKKVLLYGSYARGTSTKDSDIDVAIVLKTEPADYLKTASELFRMTADVDSRIEPKIVRDTGDPSGFWENISQYGMVVFEEK